MAHRYWRIYGVETFGHVADLEISELQFLHAGSRVDASASLSSTIAPASGAVADLRDGSMGTVVRWAGREVHAPGFAIVVDLGTASPVDSLRMGSGAAADRFPWALSMAGSDDGVTWVDPVTTVNVAYPGDATLTAIVSGGAVGANDGLFMRFEGTDGSTTFTDDAGHVFSAVGSPKLTTTNPLAGTSSLLLDRTTGDYITTASTNDINIGSGAFTIQARVSMASLSDDQWIMARLSGTYSIVEEWGIAWIASSQKFAFYTGRRGIDSFYWTFDSPKELASNTNYAIEISRDETYNWRFFVDGLQSPTTFNNGFNFSNADNNLPLVIGCIYPNHDPLAAFSGRIDDIRLVRGMALHRETFTPIDSIASPQTLLPVSGSTARMRAFGRIRETKGTAPDFSARPVELIDSATRLRDTEFGGLGTISGTVSETGSPDVPLHRRVRLYRERDGLLVGETWSDAITGAYAFHSLSKTTPFTAIAYDYAHNYRAVIADNILAV